MLSVPVDYAKPGGRHISLALNMVPATAPKSQQQGILLVNPGGPGGSGLSLAAEVAQGLSPGVAAGTTSLASTRAASGPRCPR